MDTQITEFIDLLKDNSFVAKQYLPYNLDETYNAEIWNFREEDVIDEKWYAYDVFLEELDLGHISKDELTLYEFHGYQKPTELEDFLISHYETFNNACVENNYLNDKTVIKEIVNQVRLVKNQLDILLSNCEFVGNYLLESLIKVKIEICTETIRLLNFSKIDNSIIAETNQVSANPVKIRKTYENLTNLTQNEVVILFYYLKEQGCIGNEMAKNLFANNISELTGFSAKGIRKGLSSIKKDTINADSVYFTERGFSTVRREMEKVVEVLNTETKDRFPPKP